MRTLVKLVKKLEKEYVRLSEKKNIGAFDKFDYIDFHLLIKMLMVKDEHLRISKLELEKCQKKTLSHCDIYKNFCNPRVHS